MIKKIVSLFLVTLLLLSISITASAETSEYNSEEYNEYIGYIDQGILGEDVSFEQWSFLKNQSIELEAALEASSKFGKVFDSQNSGSTYSTYTMRAGDVFITNGTSSAGLTGHAAIAISSTKILHIAGIGCNPTTISLSAWHSQYTVNGWTKVYRHSSSSTASRAANWAANTYEGSSAVYMINNNLSSTYETYCSKLVWQAYYYGADSATYLASGIVLPYSLPGLIQNISLNSTFE